MRCLEEVDYIFFTANESKRPWLDVKKAAADLPLWYGSDTESSSYDYEASEWHQRHVRFSEEVMDSEGDIMTLRPMPTGEVAKMPADVVERIRSNSGASSAPAKKTRNDSDSTMPVSYLTEISSDDDGRPTSHSAGRGA